LFQFDTAPFLSDYRRAKKFLQPPLLFPCNSHALYPTHFRQNVLATHSAADYAFPRNSYLSVSIGVPVSWDPVYRLVKLIPRGRVLTYGAVAKALRLPGGARTAGRAMAGCPSGKGIPWHRVVGANGKLLIREPYAALQRKLLETEGVEMTERRVNMKVHQWVAPKQKQAAKRRK
jgi:methylated-DNA-protein-cysteine methyltransferase-like protein